MVTKQQDGFCVCVCTHVLCLWVAHIHKCLNRPGERSKRQEETDEYMRCWDRRENCSLALMWWKVSPGPWAGLCLCYRCSESSARV